MSIVYNSSRLGNFPSSIYYIPDQIQVIELCDNFLKIFPKQIFEIFNLKVLRLDHN